MDKFNKQKLHDSGYRLEDLPLESIYTCELCGATEQFIVIADHDRFGYAVNSYLCSTCGFIWVTPRPTREGYSIFYERYYRNIVSILYNKTFDMQKVVEVQQQTAQHIDLVLLKPFIEQRSPKTMLDIGGSTGTIAKHFVDQYGISATVLDPAPDELALATESNLKTIAAFAEDYDGDQRGETFDIILISHVIHHFQDVNAVLEKAYALAHDKTLIYMDMVDFRALCRLRNYNLADGTQVDHCNSLIPEVLESFFAKHGFRILQKDISQPKMCAYVLEKSPQGGQLPSEFPYVDAYLHELVTIRNSAHLEGYLKGIAQLVQSSSGAKAPQPLNHYPATALIKELFQRILRRLGLRK